jgi:putative ABC transport system permease protein
MRNWRRLTALNRVAGRNLERRPLRTALTVLGIALGVSLIFAVDLGRISTIDSFLVMIDNLSGKAGLQVCAESDGGYSLDKLAEIRGVNGVKTAVPSIPRVIALQTEPGAEPQNLQFLAVDPTVDRHVRRYELEAGRWLKGKNEILLTGGLARRLSLKAGEHVSLVTPNGPVRVKISGLLA